MPEVSFSIYGQRGVIDILAWHAATRSLLVIELKTEMCTSRNSWESWIARFASRPKWRRSAAGIR